MLSRSETLDRVHALLGIPAPKKVRVLMPVGVPAEPLIARERRPFEERARWNKW